MQHTLHDSLGTSNTYFRIGNGSVVAMGYIPRPRVQALVLLGKTGECHKLIRLVKDWWPTVLRICINLIRIRIQDVKKFVTDPD